MEDYNFYRDNVATICSHRADISKSPEQYFAVLPFSLRYVFQSENQVGQICAVRGPIYLGSLIRAWNEYPELFTKECPSERCEALNRILAEDRNKSLDVHAMSVKEVIQYYQDEKRRHQPKGFQAIADLLFSEEV